MCEMRHPFLDGLKLRREPDEDHLGESVLNFENNQMGSIQVAVVTESAGHQESPAKRPEVRTFRRPPSGQVAALLAEAGQPPHCLRSIWRTLQGSLDAAHQRAP